MIEDNVDVNGNDKSGSDVDNKNSKIVLGIIGAIILLLLGWVFIADPYGILNRSRGIGGDPITTMVPADVPFYLSVDNTEFLTEEYAELVQLFTDAIQDQTGEDAKGFFDELDNDLEEEFGFNFTEDIKPWVSQYMGLSVLDITFNEYGEPEDGDLVFYVEIKDKKLAGEFLEKFLSGAADSLGTDYVEIDHSGTTIYEFDSEEQDVSFAIAQYKNLMIFSNRTANITNSIELKTSDSLAGDVEYKKIGKELTPNSMFVMLVNLETYFDVFEEMFEIMDISLESEFIKSSSFGKAALTVSIEEVGIKTETFTYVDSDQNAEGVNELLELQYGNKEVKTLDKYPEDTFFYARGFGLAQSIELLLDSDMDETQDIVESLELLKGDTGVDVLSFLSTIDGEYAIGLVETNEGLWYELSNVPLSLLIVMETSQDAKMMDFFESVNELTSVDPTLEIDEKEIAGMTIFDLRLSLGAEPMSALAYGNGNGWGVISMDIGLIEDGFGTSSSLADSSVYQEIWAAFPKDISPVMYINLQTIFDMIRAQGADEFIDQSLEPYEVLTVLAGGYRQIDSDMFSSTVILFIEK